MWVYFTYFPYCEYIWECQYRGAWKGNVKAAVSYKNGMGPMWVYFTYFLLIQRNQAIKRLRNFFRYRWNKIRIILKWIWTCHQYWSLMICLQDSSRTLENPRFVFCQLTCWLSVKRMNLRIHWDKWDPTHVGLHWKILSVMNRKIMNIILK